MRRTARASARAVRICALKAGALRAIEEFDRGLSVLRSGDNDDLNRPGDRTALAELQPACERGAHARHDRSRLLPGSAGKQRHELVIAGSSDEVGCRGSRAAARSRSIAGRGDDACRSTPRLDRSSRTSSETTPFVTCRSASACAVIRSIDDRGGKSGEPVSDRQVERRPRGFCVVTPLESRGAQTQGRCRRESHPRTWRTPPRRMRIRRRGA